MSKSEEYYYILVFTDKGPKFVTESDICMLECRWDGVTPKQFEREDAAYMALILTRNGNYAVAIYSLYEIDTQPFDYEKGYFEWKMHDGK